MARNLLSRKVADLPVGDLVDTVLAQVQHPAGAAANVEADPTICGGHISRLPRLCFPSSVVWRGPTSRAVS